jgi:hypothetical protein
LLSEELREEPLDGALGCRQRIVCCVGSTSGTSLLGGGGGTSLLSGCTILLVCGTSGTSLLGGTSLFGGGTSLFSSTRLFSGSRLFSGTTLHRRRRLSSRCLSGRCLLRRRRSSSCYLSSLRARRGSRRLPNRPIRNGPLRLDRIRGVEVLVAHDRLSK